MGSKGQGLRLGLVLGFRINFRVKVGVMVSESAPICISRQCTIPSGWLILALSPVVLLGRVTDQKVSKSVLADKRCAGVGLQCRSANCNME